VSFKDGATELGTGTLNASGIATFSTAALATATHSITAVYGAGANFNTSTSNTGNQVVGPSPTTTRHAAAEGPSGHRAAGSLTPTVAASGAGSGIPTGTVTFKDGTTTLGTGTLDASGVATFSTAALSTSTHSITAVYGADTNFNASTSNTVNQVVSPSPT